MSSTNYRENWSEHQTTMFSSLHEKQKLGKYCDVVLKCSDSDRIFNAHSCVLSSASSVLDKLLQDVMNENIHVNTPQGSAGKILVMLPEDVTSSCVDSLLNFIYSGNVDLCQKDPTSKDTAMNVRKSKRISSSKSKRFEESISTSDDSNMDASLLHAFLKAARCLKINTLTEHLESAVTLSEMKMTTEVTSPERSSRSSAPKPSAGKSSATATEIDKNDDDIILTTQPNKSRNNKKLQQENQTLLTKNQKSPRKKKRSTTDNDNSMISTATNGNRELQKVLEENGGLQSNVLNEIRSSNSDSLIDSNDSAVEMEDAQVITDQQAGSSNLTSSGFSCNKCEERFKSRSALKKHSLWHVSNEQIRQVDSFPVGTQDAKQLSCSKCQKKFTNSSVMQLHMKKHEEGEKKENSNSQDADSTMVKLIEDTLVGQKPKVKTIATKSAVDSPTRPPKRASAKKFRDIMRHAFSLESNEAINGNHNFKNTNKSKKKRSVANAVAIAKPSSKHHKEESEESSDNVSSTEVVTLVEVPQPTTERNIPEIGGEAVINEMNLISQEEVEMEYQILEPVTNEGVDMLEESPENTEDLTAIGVVQEYTFNGDEYTEGMMEGENQERNYQDDGIIHEQDQSFEDSQVSVEAVLQEEDGEIHELKFDENIKTKKSKRKRKKEVEDITPESEACDICGKVASNAKNMMNHMRSHSREELTCSVCSKKFKYQSALKRHQRWHTGEGQKCHVCEKIVYTQQEMTQHLSTHNIKKMRTQCPVCQKWFTSVYVMQLHLRTHSGNELFVCDFCGKRFPYKSSLKMHMRLHSGERPYICSVCGKCFVQKIHAKEHELQHAGIRRFQCELCHKMFAHKCGLSRHVADIHYKSRPYVCDHCGKSFPRKTKLVEHTRTHTGEKPYICSLCGARYKANRSLKEHKKKRHSLIVNDYEVGIWRNGPLPVEEKKPLPSRKKRSKVKVTSTFNFPVPSDAEEIVTIVGNGNKEEESIINNIAEEVDVISTDASDEKNPDPSTEFDQEKESKPTQPEEEHFTSYPMPVSTEYQHIQYTNIMEGSNYTETILPPASTLTKISHSTVLPAYHSTMQPQKTFIVPLNASASSTIPVIAEQVAGEGISHVPAGVMVTYVMPPQVNQMMAEAQTLSPVIIQEGLSNATQISRSASVPPMSTFRRQVIPASSDTVNAGQLFQTTSTSGTTLPGMHTFQPVQFHMNSTQLPHVITGFTSVQPAVPIMVSAPTVISPAVSQPVEVAADQPDISVHEQSAKWQSQ